MPEEPGQAIPEQPGQVANDDDKYWLPHQKKVDDFYNSIHIQICVAFMIGANFLTNIVEKEVDPGASVHAGVFEGFELFYNIVFTIELLVNMYAHWFWRFWMDGWNIFDVIVVTIGVISTIELLFPGMLPKILTTKFFKLFRMIRAFRVFRLFKRVPSLRKIMMAIILAVPGVANAFLILSIFMAIYAILAVEFFYDMASDCHINPNTTMITPRGNCWGPEYFGTFSLSLFTFFQVLTGDSWSEMIARPTIWHWYDDTIKAVGAAFFFVSYVLLTGLILINVVVAVLLDKMNNQEKQEEEKEKEEIEEEKDLPLIGKLELKVTQLNKDRQKIKDDLETFAGDMTELKGKLSTVLRLIKGEGNN